MGALLDAKRVELEKTIADQEKVMAENGVVKAMKRHITFSDSDESGDDESEEYSPTHSEPAFKKLKTSWDDREESTSPEPEATPLPPWRLAESSSSPEELSFPQPPASWKQWAPLPEWTAPSAEPAPSAWSFP